MPTAITDVNTFTSPIQTVSDGDGATGANFALAPQGLANRTANLKSRLDAVVASTDNGVRAVRYFATTAALQASTDHVDTTVCMVSGQGLYQYVAASTATALTPLVITPTDVGAGAGRWILLTPTGVANGVATLDSTARVPAVSVRNGIISTAIYPFLSNASTSSASYSDVQSFTTTVVAGDVMIIDGTYYSSTTGGIGNAKIVVVDNGTTYDTGAITTTATTATTLTGAANVMYTALTSGTLTIKVQITVTGAFTFTVYGSATANNVQSRTRVIQLRP